MCDGNLEQVKILKRHIMLTPGDNRLIHFAHYWAESKAHEFEMVEIVKILS